MVVPCHVPIPSDQWGAARKQAESYSPGNADCAEDGYKLFTPLAPKGFASDRLSCEGNAATASTHETTASVIRT
jgi:hypothetical protein